MILGGFGFLSRLHGLSIDNLVEVEMVLADGRIVIVNENDYPGNSSSILRCCSCLKCFLRFVVGSTRSRSRPWYCDSIQGQGISGSCRLCWEPYLVRLVEF